VLVPILPLLFVSLVALAHELASRNDISSRGEVAIALAAAPLYLMGQFALRSRALQEQEPSRAELRIEPLGWTKRHAAEWADSGRFLRAHAHPGDTMAAGAAGALPYYAGLPNLDLLGLTDGEVARHGILISNRPGHQRLATREYVLARHPTYLWVDECLWPWLQGSARGSGYVCVEGHIESSLGGEERFLFLVDRTRVAELVREGAVTPKVAPRLPWQSADGR
jgi:hypothetical protein